MPALQKIIKNLRSSIYRMYEQKNFRCGDMPDTATDRLLIILLPTGKEQLQRADQKIFIKLKALV